MDNNFQEFLHAFNELHDVIAKKVNKEPDTHFGELMGTAAKQKDKVIETYYDKIDFYRELRNLLTHHTMNDEAVALPSDALIEEMKAVTQKIKHNKKVKDLFLKKVRSFQETDTLKDVLSVIRKKHYTQFPVFNGNKLVGIISSIGITNYLAESMDKDITSIQETTLKDVLAVEDELDFYEVINQETSIFEIEEIFTKRIKEGRTAYVLLIGKNATVKSKEDLVGIVTPWDIPVIVENK